MRNLLIRGLSSRIHKQLQKISLKENLSINQKVIKLIVNEVDGTKEKDEIEERRKEAFKRLEELRPKLHEKIKYFDDSTKLIREFRDSR